MTGERSRRDVGLAGRLFGAQSLIAVVGALTLWLVASAIVILPAADSAAA